MKNKERDVPYCGINKKKFDSIADDIIIPKENLQRLNTYICDRYNTHLKKDYYKEDPPYTDNPILLKYKFTNVFRQQDRVTQWLINNISNNESISLESKVYKSIAFRLFSKIETAEILGLGDDNEFDENYAEICRERTKDVSDDYYPFTVAFSVAGLKGTSHKHHHDDPYILSPLLLVDDMRKKNLFERLMDSKDQKDCFTILNGEKGLGPFLAYQAFVDLTYIEDFPYSENEFTVAGPGCMKGILYLLGDGEFINDANFNRLKKNFMKGHSFEEFLFYLRDNIDDLFVGNGIGWDPQSLFIDLDKDERHINIMSMENIFCEFFKYNKALDSECPNPRILYKGYAYDDPLKY